MKDNLDAVYDQANAVLAEYEAHEISSSDLLRFLNASRRNLDVVLRKLENRLDGQITDGDIRTKSEAVMLDVVRDRVALLNDTNRK